MDPYLDWLIHHPLVIFDYGLWMLVIIWGLAMRVTNTQWYEKRLKERKLVKTEPT